MEYNKQATCQLKFQNSPTAISKSPRTIHVIPQRSAYSHTRLSLAPVLLLHSFTTMWKCMLCFAGFPDIRQKSFIAPAGSRHTGIHNAISRVNSSLLLSQNRDTQLRSSAFHGTYNTQITRAHCHIFKVGIHSAQERALVKKTYCPGLVGNRHPPPPRRSASTEAKILRKGKNSSLF